MVDPRNVAIPAEAPDRNVTVFHLSYRAPSEEAGPEKQFDFSQMTLDERWRAGSLDMSEALKILSTPPAAKKDRGAFAVHRIRRAADGGGTAGDQPVTSAIAKPS